MISLVRLNPVVSYSAHDTGRRPAASSAFWALRDLSFLEEHHRYLLGHRRESAHLDLSSSNNSFEQFLTYSKYLGQIVNEIARPVCIGVQITGRLAGNIKRTARNMRMSGLLRTPVTGTNTGSPDHFDGIANERKAILSSRAMFSIS